MMVVSTFAVLSHLLPPFILISLAGIALVVLRNGPQEGFGVVIGATAAMMIFGLLLTRNVALLPAYGLTFLMFWIPIFLMAWVLREIGQLRVVVEIPIVLGVIIVAAVYLFTPDPALVWNNRLQAFFAAVVTTEAIAETDLAQIEQNVELISHYMSGLFAAGTLSLLTIGLFIGRWWQSILYNPGGFGAEFLGLRTHTVFAYAGLALVLIGLLTENQLAEAAWNITMVVAFLYLYVGISVLHKIVSNMAPSRFFLILVYMVMVFIPHALLPVVLIGFTDTWLDWRNRFIRS